MKLIKFDLPIDGTKVRNIEELRDHFNTEILDLHKSGLLAKWLRSQRQPDLLAQVEAIAENSSDQARLDALCRVFSIELDSEIIQQLTQLHDQGIKRGGIRIDPLQIEYESFYEKYTDFTEKFKKYERFLEYCKQFNEADSIDDAESELMKMAHFIIYGQSLGMEVFQGSCIDSIYKTGFLIKEEKDHSEITNGINHIYYGRGNYKNHKIHKVKKQANYVLYDSEYKWKSYFYSFYLTKDDADVK